MAHCSKIHRPTNGGGGGGVVGQNNTRTLTYTTSRE